jgi:hypothetical protein
MVFKRTNKCLHWIYSRHLYKTSQLVLPVVTGHLTFVKLALANTIRQLTAAYTALIYIIIYTILRALCIMPKVQMVSGTPDLEPQQPAPVAAARP